LLEFDKLFHIYTDASDHPLVMQDKMPITFCSGKLNAAQRRYTTTARELLSTIKDCTEYKNILLGYPFIVYTDQKNNTFNGLKPSDCIFRWLSLLEEYGVTFEYLPGEKNVVADALSCLDIDELMIPQEEALSLLSESEHNNIKFPMHTALIHKDQIKVPGLRENVLSQPYYTMQHIEGMTFCAIKAKSIFLSPKDKQFFLGITNTYFTQDRDNQEKTMMWPGLT
jgi:RNase H-like domain found in reverse transcriptase